MLTNWQDVYLIVLSMSLAVTCLMVLNVVWPARQRRVHNDIIGWQVSVLGTIYAVMVGFMLYAVWTNFQTAEINADGEANALVNLCRIAEGLPDAQRIQIQTLAAQYVDVVLSREWPEMNQGLSGWGDSSIILGFGRILTRTPATNFTQQISLDHAMEQLSSLTVHRRVRQLESESKLPDILWAVLISGGIITVITCCLLGSENFTLHFMMIFAMALLISLVLVAIGDIDRPFQGTVHVSPAAFLRAQEAIRQSNSGPHLSSASVGGNGEAKN